jgi:hypothetical protein
MPLPRFEVATGPVDGTNTTFQVSTAYQPGTLAPFLNGQLKRADYDDGWVETDPATGTFDLNIAPLEGDDVQAFFLDTSPVLPGESVSTIFGSIRVVDDVAGRIGSQLPLEGKVLVEDDLVGEVGTVEVEAALLEVERLVGFVREVC